VTSGEEAIELLTSGENFDLVITTLHIEDMPVVRFAQEVRQTASIHPSSCWHMIIARKRNHYQLRHICIRPHLHLAWDYRLLIAMIKYIEDKLNVQSDTATVGVQVIILVEDTSVSILPICRFSTRKFLTSRSGLFQKALILHINFSACARGPRYYLLDI